MVINIKLSFGEKIQQNPMLRLLLAQGSQTQIHIVSRRAIQEQNKSIGTGDQGASVLSEGGVRTQVQPNSMQEFGPVSPDLQGLFAF